MILAMKDVPAAMNREINWGELGPTEGRRGNNRERSPSGWMNAKEPTDGLPRIQPLHRVAQGVRVSA